jgi:putative pyruvate formate lyase activating enzyme
MKNMQSENFEPAYLKTYREGLLAEKIEKAFRLLEIPEVSSYSPHFGEERPLVGHHGSGTIFMTHCNLKCLFCQNYSISHGGEGREISFERLGGMMVELQMMGCHNINFVTPTHYVPQVLKALPIAVEKGLKVPLVYNTGGYDSVETLKLLDGVFDIYMPDFKYADGKVAEEYSQASDYPEMAKLAFKEMHRQVGDLLLDERGIALTGLLVRHLVLPQELAGTKEVMHFLSQEISKNTYVNIMDQFYPCGRISPNSPLNRRITQGEYDDALEAAKNEGITRLDKREKLRLIWRF